MGVDEHKAAVRRIFAEVLPTGDQTLMQQLRHPDFAGFHAPGGALLRPSVGISPAGGRTFRQALPDGQWTIDLLIAEGVFVVARWTFSGTHTGVWESPLGRFPPTGRRIAYCGVNIYRFQDGLIIENWLHHDERQFVQQLTGEATVEESMGEAPSSR